MTISNAGSPWRPTWAGRLRMAVTRLLDRPGLLFPDRCAWCDRDLSLRPEASLCADCLALFTDDARPRCGRCAAGPVEGTPDGCEWCRRYRLQFESVLTLGEYEGLLREAVLQMKIPAGEAVAMALARVCRRQLGKRLAELAPDVLIPVPMHWSRQWRRGVNAAETLASGLGRELGLSVPRGLASRRRNTFPQKDLSPAERFRNVRGAFTVAANYDFRGARVMLVDDILTTGATCSELARTLRRSGAEWVGVVVLARAQGERR